MSYDEFIKFVFDRPVAQDKEWYWELDSELNLFGHEMLSFMTRVFQSCSSDLKPFSDDQVALGVNYLMNPAISDHVRLVTDKSIDMDVRTEFLLSIADLYRGCFDLRCERALCSNGEATSRINVTCFMFWDVQSLGGLIGAKRKKELALAVRKVFETILGLSNIACLESGLHGLAHAYSSTGKDVGIPQLIDDFLGKRPACLPVELVNYALLARCGMVL